MSLRVQWCIYRLFTYPAAEGDLPGDSPAALPLDGIGDPIGTHRPCEWRPDSPHQPDANVQEHP